MTVRAKPVLLSYLFAFSFITIGQSSSNFDKASGKHILSDIDYRPYKPALFENITTLPSGYRYPDINANPLLGNFKPGAIIDNVKTQRLEKDPIASLGKPDPVSSDTDDPKKQWLAHQLVTLHANNTAQKINFNFDLWAKLTAKGEYPAELSFAGISQPGKLQKPARAQKRGSLASDLLSRGSDASAENINERSVLQDDDRNEICNTQGFPYRTTGLVGPVRCTGQYMHIVIF